MKDDLLFIAKNLLYSLDLIEFTEKERKYIIDLTRKIVLILLIELRIEKGIYKTFKGRVINAQECIILKTM